VEEVARGIPRGALTLLLALAVSGATPGGEPAPLARYGFEPGEALATGPDTFAVFEPRRGNVSLSAIVRVDGARSVRLVDVPGDGDFPELQGYFPARRTGTVWARFAVLVPDPTMPWHVVLAGPGGFGLREDGIAVWLRAEDGELRHVTNGIPKRLVPLRGWTWYHVALRYDVAAGAYDLRIDEEGAEGPLVELVAQPNATSRPASAIGMFSFVGDVLRDARPSELFVDEIVLDDGEEPPALRAPGRRALFVDEWWAAARTARPAGTDAAGVWLEHLRAGEWATAERLALEAAEAAESDVERAAWHERAGDAAYLAGDPAAAVRRYAAATALDAARTSSWLRRSDMHFLLGEVDEERACRERIYGALREE
jgi:hypothetical protein